MEITTEKIKKIFKYEVDANLNIDELRPDEDFIAFGGDSLDRSSVVLAIEDTFGVPIPDTDIKELRTIDSILAYVTERAS